MQPLDSRGCCARFLSEEACCAGARWLQYALTPLAFAYGAAIRLRRAAYRRGILTRHDLGVPVISIGNLSAGGTGKTPMVEHVARRIAEMGRHPAILSRGYKAHERVAGRVRNDEALLFECRLPGIPHYADPDRVVSGKRAVAEGADCIILDDGFQHLRVKRKLDIVLVDALKPLRAGRLIPAGHLREPLSALRQAGLIILTRADLLDYDARLARRAEVQPFAPGTPIIEAAHRATGIDDLKGGHSESPEFLSGKKVMLFCGIGNPHGFLSTMQALKAEVVAARFFPDHHHYGAQELELLADAAEKSGAEEVVTTEKDAVKLEPLLETEVISQAGVRFLRRLRVLRIEMTILSGEHRLEGMLKGALA